MSDQRQFNIWDKIRLKRADYPEDIGAWAVIIGIDQWASIDEPLRTIYTIQFANGIIDKYDPRNPHVVAERVTDE